MELTHRVTSPGTYDLFYGKELVAKVKRTAEGFFARTILGDDVEMSTMKALKEAVIELAKGLRGLVQRVEEKPFYITVDDARRMTGMSHSRVAGALKELYLWHPYLRQHQFGAAMVKMAFETAATWEWATWERKWLKENQHLLPHMKTPDYDYYDQTRKVRYLD